MKNMKMKIIYAGIIIPVILASVFIGFVANDVIFDETKDLDSIVEKLTGNQAQDSLPEQPPEPLTGKAQLLNPQPEIPINTWLEGESVKVEHSFANNFIKSYELTHGEDSSVDWYFRQNSFVYSYHDDSNKWEINYLTSAAQDSGLFYIENILISAPASGTLYYEFTGYVEDEFSQIGSFTAVDSTFSVNSTYIDGSGEAHFIFGMTASNSGNFQMWTLLIVDVVDGSLDTVFTETKAYTDDDLIRFTTTIDEFRFLQDPLTQFVRSKYYYISPDTLEHQIDIWIPATSNVTLYLPVDWNFTSMTPVFDYSISTPNDFTVIHAFGNTKLTLFFSRSSQKQYLAISTEKTYDMEGELPDHDLIASSTTYDGDYGISEGWSSINYKGDNTLNSTIVSNGAFSLRMDGNLDSPNYRAYLGFYVPYGEYYFSFDYYVETSDGTLAFFDFFIAGSGTVVSALTLDQTANRWHKGFAFGNCKYTYYSQAVICVRDTSDFVVFFDNIQFLKVNHQQETIDYSQTLFSGQFNSWTSKGLIPLPFEEINLELRDRTGDSSIKAIETMTDSQGFFSWIFQGKLLEKEYEFRSWSWDSWWDSGGIPLIDTESVDEWTTESANLDITLDSDSKVGDYAIKCANDGTVSTFINPSYDPEPDTIDVQISDYIVFWAKQNVGTEAHHVNDFDVHFYDNVGDGSSWYQFVLTNQIVEDSWEFVIMDMNQYDSGSTPYGWTLMNSDLTNSDRFYFRFRFVDDLETGDYISFDGLRGIQAQKSYFTPLPTGSIDYAMKMQEDNPLDSSYWGTDGCDFQEETDDAISGSYGGDINETKDGYLCSHKDLGETTTNWISLGGYVSGVDKAYYTHVIIRIKAENTSMHFIIATNGYQGLTNDVFLSTSYQIFESDVSTDPDWVGATGLIIAVYDGLDGQRVWIDYVRVVHRDSGLENGNSWEFNEDFAAGDYTKPHDGWRNANGLTPETLVVNNGYLQYEDSTGGSYCRIKTEDQLNWDDITGVIVRIRTNTIVDGPKINVGQEGGSVSGFQWLNDGWTTLTFEFSWTGHYPMRISLDQAGVWSTDIMCQIEFIRWIIDSPPNLHETQTDFLLENEGFLDYITFTDSIFSGYYANMDLISKNLTIGSHSLIYSAYYDYLRSGVTLPSVFYKYDYDIEETGVMKIIIHDQSGNVIPFDSFKVFIDSTRLFDNYLYFTDISQTFNLTITDIFDNMLYQDTTESFEQFKEIQITLYSIKLQNQQEYPVWIRLKRGEKTYSEAIFPFEIVEFKLESDTYDVRINYTTVNANKEVIYNGTYVTYQYTVNKDTAIFITGKSIQDVFNNVVQVSQDIDNVNASLSNQIVDVDIHVTNVNTSITNQVVSVEIFLDNVNTTLGTQLLSINTDINNVNTTLYAQIISVLTQIANTNSTLYAQDLQILSDIQNVNVTLYAQDMTILTNISNTNSTLHAQNINILQDLAELKGIYRVHFSVIDGAGIGLPFETVLLSVNGSRQFDQDVYLSNNTYFEAEAFDWFDVSLWSDNFSIIQQTEVNISIQLYWVLFENNGSYTSYLEIWRNNKLGVNITVAPDQTVSIRLTEGVYDYRVYYFTNDSQEITAKDPSIYSYGRKLLSIGKFAVSALMPTKINVSTPKIKLPLWEAIMAELTLVEIVANVILTVLGLAASYFVLNFIVRRAIGRHAQDPSYVPPRDRDDWLDKAEKKVGLKTDDEGLW